MASFDEIWEKVSQIGWPGMLSEEDALWYYEHLTHYRPLICVEIGVHLGRSLVLTALTTTEWGGLVDGFDPFDPRKYTAEQGAADYQGISGDDVYKRVKETTRDLRNVNIFRMTGNRGSKRIGWDVNWLYIDGDHHPQAVAGDLKTWLPKIRRPGVVVMDDFYVEGIQDEAIDRMGKPNDVSVSRNKALFEVK